MLFRSGWRGSTESGNELLCCDACFQRVGLWMYQPGYKPSYINLDSASPEASAETDGEEDKSVIDLIEMHREHCPWRNPETQCASGSLAGLNACQVLQRVTSTYAREQKRRSNAQAGGYNEENQPPTEERDENNLMPQKLSREKAAEQDKERESRLRKLKNLFSLKRRPTKVLPKAGTK